VKAISVILYFTAIKTIDVILVNNMSYVNKQFAHKKAPQKCGAIERRDEIMNN
jgi:hypothetical protein